MQTIYLDISNKGVIPTIHAKQGDVGRKFQVVLTDSGLPYIPVGGSAFSVWYKGVSGEGNYTDIGNKSAFSLNGNKVEVEMIVQMLSTHGDGILCLTLNSPNGNQISSWNIPYLCEKVPGFESEGAKEYYTAFSQAVAGLAYPDASLSVAGKAADAEATGKALEGKAPAGYGLGGESKFVNDVNHALWNGWYYIAPGTLNIPDGMSGYADIFVKTRSDSIAQYIRAVTDNTSLVRYRIDVNSEWIVEWENPPMKLGVEYRTTERWNSKEVYTMMANIGALPNNTGKTTDGGPLPIGITPISAYGIGLNGKTGAVIPSRHIYLSVYGEWGTVYVNTDSDYSNYTGYIIVKYVKD